MEWGEMGWLFSLTLLPTVKVATVGEGESLLAAAGSYCGLRYQQ